MKLSALLAAQDASRRFTIRGKASTMRSEGAQHQAGCVADLDEELTQKDSPQDLAKSQALPGACHHDDDRRRENHDGNGGKRKRIADRDADQRSADVEYHHVMRILLPDVRGAFHTRRDRYMHEADQSAVSPSQSPASLKSSIRTAIHLCRIRLSRDLHTMGKGRRSDRQRAQFRGVPGVFKRRRLYSDPLWVASLLVWIATCLPSSATTKFLWGVNGHPFTAYGAVSLEEQIRLVDELGMGSYRVNITAVDQGDQLARLLAIAERRQIKILPVLIPPVDLAKDSEAEILLKARAFARSFVGRFKAKIDVWELGNETENFAIIQPCEMRDDGTKYPCEWGPAGGLVVQDYYGPRAVKVIALLRGLSEGARSQTKTARLAIGSAGWGHVGIIQRLLDQGVDWDITVWHVYGFDYEWALKRLAAFGKPIWITEFNSPLIGGQKDDKAQADGLRKMIQSVRYFSERYRIEAAFVYELLDEPYWAPSFEASMGLAQLLPSRTGSWVLGPPKPAFAAVAETIARSAHP